jgi:prepilin-type N-terminal cleavage/methylation domain-containing protein
MGSMHKKYYLKEPSLNRNGFTIVELVVVMVIIGVIAGVILPVFLHGGLDEGASVVQSSVFNAKTYAVTTRARCTLTLNADYYNEPNPLPCLLTVEDLGKTFKKQFRLPRHIRFWQHNSDDFTSGTWTIYFEPRGIAHYNQGSDTPEDIVITIKDTKTNLATNLTIIGSTCMINE